ncbi:MULTISPECIES: GAF domain-containing protein [unclassified Kribbella]|uniref:GAF domain-containing protein n=1 Tax=unclassified Kribbella TaxID=2644121 RepID=UPI0033CFDC60
MDEPSDAEATPAAAEMSPERLGLGTLAELVRASMDGIAVLDERGRLVYINPSGSRILGRRAEQLVGRTGPFLTTLRLGRTTPSEASGEVTAHSVGYHRPDGSERELEYSQSSFHAEGRGLVIVTFRDVTESQVQARRVAAFARTASSIAFAESLQAALDRVASEVFHATGVAGCAVVPVDPESRIATVSGTAGLPEDYAARVEECRRLGAPLAVYRVFELQRPIVWPDWRREVLGDPRWAPLHDVLRQANWGAFVAVPMLVRGRPVGVLTVFYRETYEPGEADVAFLSAMADHAAVAVENARMFDELERHTALEERHRLARELHDSISQALFAMTMTARAVELAAQRRGLAPDDPIELGVAELRDLTQGALAEMRALIFQLRPGALHEEGLVAGIRRHAAAVAARERLDISVEGPDDALPLDEATENELFRMVQEALHNVVKHAQASHVGVEIREDPTEPGSLFVQVSDDGVGFDPDADYPGHLGLRTMRERIEGLGGRIVIDSTPGVSTVVRAVAPGALTSP